MKRKLIVVTGGTKGIGKAIVEKFARNGFDIVVCSRSNTQFQELKQEVEAIYGAKVYVHTADLSKKEDVNLFISFIQHLQRPIDVLVNNTGVFLPGEIHNEEEGRLEHMIETNLYSAYHLTRGLIGKMMERKKGHIFNMCSIASIIAYPNGGSYSISKFALYGFSKALREEVKEFGIKVTAVLPGATLTSSWDGVPLSPERFVKSEDVSEAIFGLYSLSDSAVVEELIIRPQLGDIKASEIK